MRDTPVAWMVASANEGFDLLRTACPDLLLSDIGMAGVTGRDRMRRIRALPKADGGDVPAVALTASARREEREKALTAGFDDHVTKPVAPDELVSLLANLRRRATV